MQHAFGSIAILQPIDFSHLRSYPEGPQAAFWEKNVNDYLPSEEDVKHIQEEYAILIGRTVARLVPALNFVQDFVKKPITGLYSSQLTKKKKVPTVEVLYRNEMKLDEVVDILESYEDMIADVYNKAGASTQGVRVHTGGDQLTRERFSRAKTLRIGAEEARQRFAHIGPITFELFHMMMKFLEMIFQQLYTEGSIDQMGTMKAEQAKISRTNVNREVHKAYEPDKDFVISFVDCYIVEAVLEFFGMTDIYSAPTRHCPPTPPTAQWFSETFGQIVKEMVGPNIVNINNLRKDAATLAREKDGYLTLKLSNGKEIHLPIAQPKKGTPKVDQQDFVNNYGHRVLELGLLFKSLLDGIKFPDRDRFLRLLKLTMVNLKANNNRAKYPFEILRLLVHQETTLSLEQAHEEFYGLFVNTSGKMNSHIPADERMEWMVHVIKKHICHMFSNKNEKNIITRSKSLAGVTDIGKNFDYTTEVVKRNKKHQDASSLGDEITMLNDIHQLRPFHRVAGRSHRSFPNIEYSLMQALDAMEFRSWVESRAYKFASELGN